MKRIDVLLLAIVIILTIFGIFMIYDASSYVAFRDFGDKYHYVKDQFVWFGLGLVGMLFFAKFNYHKLYYLSLPILFVAIILLVLVLIPGFGVKLLGARRWINFGAFVLQPAEFVKLGLAIYLSSWMSHKEKGRFLAFILLLGLVIFLVILQPDMGTGIVILSEALVIYFLSGGNIFYFFFIMPILAGLGYILIMIAPYRAERLATFFNFNQSIQSSSYHVRQILIAFGSGGLTGVGLGESLQKYAYLPESTTDSIFAIFAEETGFIGASALVLLFIFFFFRALHIAKKAPDIFGQLLAAGFAISIMTQAFINMAAISGVLPLTGITLPFISYGSTSLIITMCMAGIILNISKYKS
jgi:cell division protein FtsW